MKGTGWIRAAKSGYIATSMLWCAAGLLLIFLPGTSVKLLCMAAGGLLTVCGIIKIIGYFSKDLYRLAFQFDLALGLLCLLLGLILLLNILGLPANWVVVLLVVLWKFLHPAAGALDVWFWIMFLGLAVLGEVLEMGVQVMNAKRHGSSTSGTVAGMVGAIAGAIFLAPLFFGLGAFIGALVGAWLGCLVMELLRGRPGKEAFDAAFGTMMGRFLGTVCKLGTGSAMVVLTAHRIWPDMAPVPPPLHPVTPEPGQVVMLLKNWLC